MEKFFYIFSLSFCLAACGGPPVSGGLEPGSLDPARLNSIWQLVAINGEAIDPAGATPPYLDLNLETGHASGFGGCNEFDGTLVLKAENIIIGSVAATNKKCAAYLLERKFILAISGREHKYTYPAAGELLLKSIQSELEFTRVGGEE
ncbi:MAG: META domain-containing protein [Saprospiraceae bacterium]